MVRLEPAQVVLFKIMVTTTRHVFISIFQTEHFSAVKFVMGMRKIWAFLWYQNRQKFEKKLKR